MMETRGSAVIKPANSGFLPDNHDAKTTTKAAMQTFIVAAIMNESPCSTLFFYKLTNK